jgi:hypothetical protein
MKHVFTLRTADEAKTTVTIEVNDRDADRWISHADLRDGLLEHHRAGTKAVFALLGFEVGAWVVDYRSEPEAR